MSIQTNHKVAVITGASGTLCSHIAKELAHQGYKVALIGRNRETLDEVVQQIKDEGGIVMGVAADVTNLTAIQQAHETILNQLGEVSILINGAGGNQPGAITNQDQFDERELSGADPSIQGFLNMDLSRYSDVLQINSMGTVIPCQVFAQDMIRNRQGCIINFSSMNGERPLSRVPAYAMAKAGINNFTQWLAAYLAPVNIRVNAIAPGFFINDKNRSRLLTDDGQYTSRGEHVIRQTPMHRFGQPNELAGCVNWLIDEQASGFVTGIVIPIDGGFLANAGI